MTAALSTTLVAGVLAIVVVTWVLLRRRKEASDALTLQASVQLGQHIPPSLHPIIDSEKCIGSFSCIRACPEGDILGIIDGKAALVEASHCIGHSRCAVECPVNAITLVFGTKEKGVDLPENDESFESSRPGVFIIGELGGMGLIKNALRQGLDVAERLVPRLRTSGNAKTPGTVDVLIVGAGPAGVACAVACKKRGLAALCVEQEESVGGAIAHYPRGKIVMTERVELPYFGKFGKPLVKKEELAADLDRLLKMAEVSIQTSTHVEGIEGSEGAFTVKTSRGPLSARVVVLAIGLRGRRASSASPAKRSRRSSTGSSIPSSSTAAASSSSAAGTPPSRPRSSSPARAPRRSRSRIDRTRSLAASRATASSSRSSRTKARCARSCRPRSCRSTTPTS